MNLVQSIGRFDIFESNEFRIFQIFRMRYGRFGDTIINNTRPRIYGNTNIHREHPAV